MQIHVARPPEQFGVFSPEEVAEGLRTGRFLPSDHGWREGMAAWSPLSQWPEFAAFAIPDAPSDASLPPSTEPTPSWERGASLGNLFATIREVATEPVRTFDQLRPEGSMTRPLVFNYVTALPGFLLLFVIYAALFSAMGSGFLENFGAGAANPFAKLSVGAAVAILGGGLFCLYLLLPVGQFVGSAILHVLLLPWGPKGGYAGSYRANSYVNGAFFPLTCIPCVNYVAMPWQVVVNVIALSRVHKIEWWKVLLSVVVIPGCLCCSAYLLFFMKLAKLGRGF